MSSDASHTDGASGTHSVSTGRGRSRPVTGADRGRGSDGRERVTIDVSTGGRAALLKRVKALTDADNDAAAFEAALKATIDFYALVEEHRGAIGDEKLDLEYHRLDVGTALNRK